MGESNPCDSKSALSDRKLLEASCNGDSDAYGEFVYRYSGPLFRYCWGRLRDHHLVQDVIQEVFLRVYSSMKNRIPDDPGSWLFGVARNCCQEMERWWTRRVPAPLPDSEHLVAPADNQGKGGEELDAFLEHLTDEQRTLIYLKHVSGLRCREIAQRLDKPLGTVTAALSRAYSRLRDLHAGEREIHG